MLPIGCTALPVKCSLLVIYDFSQNFIRLKSKFVFPFALDFAFEKLKDFLHKLSFILFLENTLFSPPNAL